MPEGSGEQGKMEKTGCKIICGAPKTLAVKGLMMMIMMIYIYFFNKFELKLSTNAPVKQIESLYTPQKE